MSRWLSQLKHKTFLSMSCLECLLIANKGNIIKMCFVKDVGSGFQF